jgi:ubiquinone/menaquinone biosynthesis C-methylase UbiE
MISQISKTDYSKIAKHYDRVRPPPEDIWVSKVIAHGKVTANSMVLDVGCGTGRYPLAMQTFSDSVFCALDPSMEMLKQAVVKDKSKRVLWVGGDGQLLPFKDNLFDCIYMTLVVHHIENKEMALQEIHRCLKKGGNCVIMTNSHSRIRTHVISDFPGVLAIDLKRFPSIPLLKKVMKQTGFRNVHHHVLKHERGYVPTEVYLERVRNKYISTLTLLSEDEFQRGLEIFVERVRRKYGKQIKQVDRFIFIVGWK